MKRVVIVSGKGGVGKSTITASIAYSFRGDIICADCDVDASNLSLLFSKQTKDYDEWKPVSTNHVARIDHYICKSCGICEKNCYFDAIKDTIIDPLKCEGCGVCGLVCPNDAIDMKEITNAHIGHTKVSSHKSFYIVSAQLIPGSSGSGKVVNMVKNKSQILSPDSDYMIIDAPAGTGCPVIASITGSDYAIVVCEPSESSFSDMKKIINIINHFHIEYGIVINKYDSNKEISKTIEDFSGGRLLMKLPFDNNFVDAAVKLKPVVIEYPEYKKTFEHLSSLIRKHTSP